MSADSRSEKGEVALIINDEDLRIVMVGKTGTGKSRSANTILGHKAFNFKIGGQSVTESCEKVRGEVNGRKVSVVDTPGLFDTKFTHEQTIQEIKQCICYASPGPHVFLIVIKIGRFTEEEQKAVQMIRKLFGEMSTGYTMILFTGGDDLEDEDQTIEEILEDTPKLKEFVRECEGRYHVFNNKSKDRSQVTELLEKINSMVLNNGGSHYTNEMFQKAERAIEEEMQKILKEKMEKLKLEYLGNVPSAETNRIERESRAQAEMLNPFLIAIEVAMEIAARVGEFIAKVIDKVGEALVNAAVDKVTERCSIQ